MAFGPKRPTFKPTPYGYARRSRGIPRWLLLLITGIVLGAGGVLFLQRSYGPQRLSIEQSEQLRTDLNTVNLENQRLGAESKKLHETLARLQQDGKDSAHKMALLRKQVADTEAGVANLIQAIPADPRGGTPGIRSADMILDKDGLHYHILLIQDLPDGQTEAPPLRGTVKLVAMGTYPNGNRASLDVSTQPLDMNRYTVVDGLWPEPPKGFRPFQVTVQVLADDSGKVTSTRTVKVSRR